jgi:hypothetical protein
MTGPAQQVDTLARQPALRTHMKRLVKVLLLLCLAYAII